MSFPRYPKYKDSGVEWLGQVPAHWSLTKLKSVASFSGGRNAQPREPCFLERGHPLGFSKRHEGRADCRCGRVDN